MARYHLHDDPTDAVRTHAALTLIAGVLMLLHPTAVLFVVFEGYLFRQSYLRVGRQAGVIDGSRADE